MIRGLYTAGWSMLANTKKMDLISNNLANTSTQGYKKDRVTYEAFPDVLTKRLFDYKAGRPSPDNIGKMALSSDISQVYTDFSQGNLEPTENSTDMSIKDAQGAFFCVGQYNNDGQIEELYTKNGSFVINGDGQLMTKDGNMVLGEAGAIYLEGSEFMVESDGTIIQNSQVVGKLLIKEFSDVNTLRKRGDSLYTTTDDSQTTGFSGEIIQGFVEQSNVSSIGEMVEMINLMRAYEANQKMITAQDSTLDKAVNELGRI